jgi:hypothetical protein
MSLLRSYFQNFGVCAMRRDCTVCVTSYNLLAAEERKPGAGNLRGWRRPHSLQTWHLCPRQRKHCLRAALEQIHTFAMLDKHMTRAYTYTVGEGMLPSLAHARANLLRASCRVIPQAAQVFCVPIETFHQPVPLARPLHKVRVIH